MEENGTQTAAPRGVAAWHWSFGLAAIVLGTLSTAICLSEISITYALPNAIGHDTNEMAVAMSAVSGVGVLAALAWLVLAGRSVRWGRLLWIPMLLIVVSVLAVVITFTYHANYVY